MKDIREEIVNLYLSKKATGESFTYQNIADIINEKYNGKASSESIRSVIRRYKKNINSSAFSEPFKTMLNYFSDGSRESSTIIDSDNISNISPEELLLKHGFDSNKFSIVKANNSMWGNTNSKKYSSKIIVKPKSEFVFNEEYFDKLFSKIDLEKYSSFKNKKQTKNNSSGKCLIIPIVDLHYGMFVTSDVAKDEYNREVAAILFLKTLYDILDRTKNEEFEKIFFTIGSDMINCDNKSGSTTKGTPQNNDGFVEEFISDVTELLITAIEELKVIAPVEVIYINSNHDSLVSYGIANTLYYLYEKDSNVNVDRSSKERKYKVFGNTLIGFAHKLNSKNVNSIIQLDARKLMSKTTNTVYLLQHYHRENAIDECGTDVRVLPTISALSRWAYESGYGSARKCQSFILDKNHGITDVLYTFIDNTKI